MEKDALLELTGAVERVIYHNDQNQYTVFEMHAETEDITVVGSFPYISEGEELVVYGKWSMHSTFGQQFKAEAFEHRRPATTAALLKYLSSGAIKGIGKSLAERIIETFGEQAMEVIENDPIRLSQIKGISESKALKINEEINKVFGIRELIHFLASFGVKPEDAVGVWKRFGQNAIELIQEAPYSICDDELAISFEIADAIAAAVDKAFDNIERVKAGAKYVLRHNLNNGHICLPADKLCLAAADMLKVKVEIVQDAVIQMCRAFELINESIDGRDYLFLPKAHQSEAYIAERMKLMLKYPPQRIDNAAAEIAYIEEQNNIRYAEKQKQAICAALEKGVLILTGGPGTGKTTTLNAIISMLKKKGEVVILAAPTGRAAKRMSDLTGEEAKTLHRLLQVEWDEHDRAVFKKNEADPLDCDCIVVDELSMVDSYVFESLLRALPMSCRLICVGDSDQLPSVGAGNVLGDLIASGLFETVQLNEIFRQSMQSLIVTNAHRIVEGDMPILTVRDNDFFFMPHNERRKAQDLITELCAKRLPMSYGYSSITDIQVLCPGRKGELGTNELNKRLREAINPADREKPEIKLNGQIYRVGDKVMHIKNNYDLVWETQQGVRGEGVYNGDLGTILEIDKPAGILLVQMDDRIVSYDFTHAAVELELAYAMTVHKSQGNEFSAVIIPVLNPPRMLCYRNLFYTAITRAKELLILVGNRSTIQQMVENNRKTLRYTGLLEFLRRNGKFSEL